ncbi:hypothetical protein J2S82_001410 [Aeromonas caviae]|uniref:hypothetical protein n=1 Tax=Aeromonas caviae TaxID=648 RepID=UPI00209CDD1F|nr:hypothetical protein [Aeromonas caviae]MCP1599453.1 hypothetical protein [Aeromonas caviae]
MSHANHAPLVNRSKLEAEIQCGSHAGICHAYVTRLFYAIEMVVQKEKGKRKHSGR